MAMHSLMEIKEKYRYLNFVSSASHTSRRVRTHSTTAHATGKAGTASNLSSPGSQVDSVPHEVTVLDSNAYTDPQQTIHTSLNHTPIPLSSSHDTSQLRDELTSSNRRRSSSFTGEHCTAFICDRKPVLYYCTRHGACVVVLIS